MIDPQHPEDVGRLADTLTPPLKVGLLMHLPAIKRNAPVLPPLLHELIVLEERFRRGSAVPVEIEEIEIGPDITAVEADAEGDVSHQADVFGPRILGDSLPLLEGDPLDIGVVAKV